MTFVTVGNAKQRFRRLLDAVEQLNRQRLLPRPVVFQSGHDTEFVSRDGTVHEFLKLEEFEECVERARLVIAHAGAGAILYALMHGRPLVVMPRLVRYGEVVDDHQVQLAESLGNMGRVTVAWQAADLQGAVEAALGRPASERRSMGSTTSRVVAACLDEVVRDRKGPGRHRVPK